MPRRKDSPHEADQVEGRNPVLEALRGPREVHEIYVAKVAERTPEIEEIINLARAAGVPVKDASRDRIDAMSRTSTPQGIIARVEPYRFLDLAELLDGVSSSPLPLVLVLDRIEDPQNLGALLRVAETAGVDAVVVPGKRSAGITPAVAKASAGAVEYVKVARVSSLSAAVERLKAAGLWVAGAEAGEGVPYYELDMTVPLAIVLGSEGQGLSRLVKESCDSLVSLPVKGRVGSLNVSTAGAVLLYEAVRQRTAGVPQAN
jgi:23S rRNA (guanosine2251-2'-O)-methyltransferase